MEPWRYNFESEGSILQEGGGGLKINFAEFHWVLSKKQTNLEKECVDGGIQSPTTPTSGASPLKILRICS